MTKFLIRRVIFHHSPLIISGQIFRIYMAVRIRAESFFAVLSGNLRRVATVNDVAVADHFVGGRPDRIDVTSLVMRAGIIFVIQNIRQSPRRRTGRVTGIKPVRRAARRRRTAGLITGNQAPVCARDSDERIDARSQTRAEIVASAVCRIVSASAKNRFSGERYAHRMRDDVYFRRARICFDGLDECADFL